MMNENAGIRLIEQVVDDYIITGNLGAIGNKEVVLNHIVGTITGY